MLQVALGISHSLKSVLRLSENLRVEVDWTSVMTAENKETEHFAVIILKQVSYCLEIAQRLGHFLPVNVYISVMHPVMGEFAAVVSLRLSNFILMMRELQIFASAVDINGIPQEFS